MNALERVANATSNALPRKLSVVLPARNEAVSLAAVLPILQKILPGTEILVVSDASTDGTDETVKASNARLVRQPYQIGNGAAVKAGARAASGDVLIFMDADGQHLPEDIPKLLAKLDEGYDMAVGARSRRSQANIQRAAANGFYNRFASLIVGQKVHDLTSGFRAVRAEKFRRFLYLLPNGFSYPTTITMAFFRAGFPVAYVPIEAPRRTGKSHLRPFRDGVRFLMIIFKVATLYSPLKVFLPISLTFFTTGLGYYLYTFLAEHRFTNMSALLLSTSVLIFLMGLVSEQITVLNYKDSER
jgi:glycosyltransferase involved in cell wall biosynthesis